MAPTTFPQRAPKSSQPEVSSPNTHKRLASLPPEIHHIIADHLPYPDLLSLKLTDTYFAALVGPKLTVKSRVSWVQSRYAQRLPVPTSTKLSFRTDELFVANPEVNAILRRRRRHLECADRREPKVALGFSAFTEVDRNVRRLRGAQQLDTTACLVTGAPNCPAIPDLDTKVQRYRNSVVGKLTAPVFRTVAWLRGLQRSFRDSLSCAVAGLSHTPRVLWSWFLATLKLAFIVVVASAACTVCRWRPPPVAFTNP
ncbi:hypothetical protein AYO21_05647 [Fonsecaea monophora]|uniref:F-box domain-containing protein n=1 Tax=Fonsecaea monophora TaxID=254056 RepID=A0A177FAB7_9EURO|nr:hypothetical protein AYO21_05647 [Fonsecaea monophora]KAH0839232.1 hypothetical protein FOPE_05582 [Fonsecaea pedrosoi]OAG40169.1 hypothetical protein AYO21_05647 [Fonsecaea monophora]